MGFLNRILGFRDFVKKNEIIELIESSTYLTPDENLNEVKELIFFETNRQKSWLISSDKYVYCVLDDIELNKTEIRWKINKEEILNQQGQLNQSLNVYGFSDKTGQIDFGENHKRWKYSKKLFPTENSLRESIKNILN